MAYDQNLADRISTMLRKKKIKFEEKKMFGGVAYMVKDKMCIGIVKDDLMGRTGPEHQKAAQKRKGCRPMDFNGKPMTGYVYVNPAGADKDKDLEYYLDLCLDFNKEAKSSKKKPARKK